MTLEDARAMLAVIPADDRALWIRVGMALRDALGDSGEELWHSWSATSDRYRRTDASAAWRSFRPGRVTARSLAFLARQHGYAGDQRPSPAPLRRPPSGVPLPDAARNRELEAESAALRAGEMIAEARIETHPYAEAKGFPAFRGFVDEAGRLLIPARREGRVVAVQAITAGGTKRFLPRGCRMAGAAHRLGRRRNGGRSWLVEGWATGMSVLDALDVVCQRDDEVLICFSAGQLVAIGRTCRSDSTFVIADNDESGAGEAAARKSGLRWWMPPERGDANDYALSRGPRALADSLRSVITRF